MSLVIQTAIYLLISYISSFSSYGSSDPIESKDRCLIAKTIEKVVAKDISSNIVKDLILALNRLKSRKVDQDFPLY